MNDDARQRAASADRPRTGTRDSRDIVLIDDDAQFVALVEAALVETNWSLVSFLDADEGILHLMSHRPEILIVDIRMPKMDGNEVLDTLAEEDRLDGVRLLASSSALPPGSIWRAFERRGVEFVPKDDLVNRDSISRILTAS